MHQVLHRFHVATRGRGFVDLTADVSRWLGEQDVSAGLLTLFCRHTSASLIIQENTDPDVRVDLEAFFADLAPEAPGAYVHSQEGPDDMPAHIRTALTQTHLAVPVEAGRMLLGVWQAIYLFEHRRAPQRREIAAHLIGQ